MPKKKFELGRLKSFVIEFGDNVFAIVDAEVLLCRYCEVKIDHHRRSSVIQHLKTEKHVRAVRRVRENGKPAAKFERFESKDSVFNIELCNALVSAGIPFDRLSNPKLRKFLEIYTGNAVPAESTLRTLYVYDCYERTMEKIRRRVAGKKIWASVDGTADAGGRLYVANVVIGTLETAGATFLLNAEVLETVDHRTVGQLFDRSLSALWPADRTRRDDVLLFLSDASPCMVECGVHLGAHYPKMIHVTCVGRALHGVCEEIRGRFGAVDEIVGNMWRTFEKSPARLQTFRRSAPDVPLPPAGGGGGAEPVSWIDSAVYCCDHFDEIRRVVDVLADGADDALSVKTVRKYLNEKRCRNDLIYIKLNFRILSRSISRLRSERTTLAESLRIVEDVRAQLRAVRDEPGSRVYQRLEDVLTENAGLNMLQRIAAMARDGGAIDLNGLPEHLAADDLRFYEYAPIVSVDAERAFPVQADFFANNRITTTSINTMKHLVIQCNSGLESIKNHDAI